MDRTAYFALAALLLPAIGCKANPPSPMETRIVSSAKHSLFVGNKKQKNPLAATPDTIADGREAFSHYCMACHGMDGQNTGVPFADRMSPPVPSLASREVQDYSDGQLKWVIDYGIWPSGNAGCKGHVKR